MTNQTTSAVVTPPQIIRAKTLVPNGKETDSSIHYDEFHPVTDADIIWFVNYLKNSEVAAILGTDTVQKAIEKLDRKDDYIESKADAAQATADGAVRVNDQQNEAISIAQNTANEAMNMIVVSNFEQNGQFFIKFKNRFIIQGGYGSYNALNSWVTIPLHISVAEGACIVFVIPAYEDSPQPVAVKDVASSSFKMKGANIAQWLAVGYL